MTIYYRVTTFYDVLNYTTTIYSRRVVGTHNGYSSIFSISFYTIVIFFFYYNDRLFLYDSCGFLNIVISFPLRKFLFSIFSLVVLLITDRIASITSGYIHAFLNYRWSKCTRPLTLITWALRSLPKYLSNAVIGRLLWL